MSWLPVCQFYLYFSFNMYTLSSIHRSCTLNVILTDKSAHMLMPPTSKVPSTSMIGTFSGTCAIVFIKVPAN